MTPQASRTLHLPAGTLGVDGYDVAIEPQSAGWNFAGLKVLTLDPGQSHSLKTNDSEVVVLPLSGGCVVLCDDAEYVLNGRTSVFDRVSDFAYVPCESELVISSENGGSFALPSAKAREKLVSVYGPADAVPVEVRGAGVCTRQITNFLSPEAFSGADRMCCVEVLTPSGNWSSYPPHKHDTESECEAVLEEIYYFQIEGDDGFAAHRTYDLEERWDVTVTIHSGDVFLVPRGYHGPSMAAPGYDLWYLNVLAGPGAERSMAFCDDPAHHWIRGSWDGVPLDPRVPMTSANGRCNA